MSIEAISAVWKHSRQSGGARLVLLALADFASDKNEYRCWPTIEQLADMTRLNPRHVTRCLKAIVSDGEIAVLESSGRGRANEYDLSPLMEKVTSDTEPGKRGVTSDTERVTSDTLKGDICDIKGDISDKNLYQMSPQPLYNRYTTVKGTVKTVNGSSPDSNDDSSQVSNEDALLELVEVFCQETGIKPPGKVKPEQWFTPLVEIYNACNGDFEATQARIVEAIGKLHGLNYTISTPASIQRTAVTLAQQTRKKSTWSPF